MTSLNPQRVIPDGIKIDTRYLLRQVPSLVQVRRKQRSWNEFGASLIHNLKLPGQANRPASNLAETEELSEWMMAKQLIHGVLATHDSQYEGIRKRLGPLNAVSTTILYSTLGLWLAGVLGISITVTKPMVAVILFAVAEAAGDWKTLE